MWGWFLSAAVTGLVSAIAGRAVWLRHLPLGARAAAAVAVLSGAAFPLIAALREAHGGDTLFPSLFVFLGALAIGSVLSEIRQRRAIPAPTPEVRTAGRWGLAAFYVGSGVVTGMLASWQIDQTPWSWPLWLLLSTWSYATVLALGRASANAASARPATS